MPFDENKPRRPKTRYQVMRPLTEEEYAALKQSIAENGVQVPIVKDADGNVIDGHHRKWAWEELRHEGLDLPDYPQEVRADLETDEEKRNEAYRLNMNRRHLNREEKREMIKRKLKETPHYADRRIASILGAVDPKTVGNVRAELERGEEIPHVLELEGQDGKIYKRQKPFEKYPEIAGFPRDEQRKMAKKLDDMPESERAQTRAELGQYDPETLAELTDKRLEAFKAAKAEGAGGPKRVSAAANWHKAMAQAYTTLGAIDEHEGGFQDLIRGWSEDQKDYYLQELERFKLMVSGWIEILEGEMR